MVPDLTTQEMQTVFDFLELKRRVALSCWLCGGNQWSGRKAFVIEDEGTPRQVPYVQLICRNCKFVALFAPSILDGI